MNRAVMDAMKELYNNRINPEVKNIEIDIEGTVVKWKVIIEESADGKAYTGFNSRGGASSSTESKENLFKRVNTQVNTKQKSLPGELNETYIEFKTVLDYYNPKVSGKSGIRQVFFQYTKPKKFPNIK